ncbi:winged helix-turn-helix transcriptional regulator [Paenibacillus sp. 7523-1]|uniref:winged helix-turn-helix transcriptional regulator n=1 Tax=Paenibacillus sp. 7523-1 TaxID=2022550 RepID=UPI000BA6C7A3|nr:helix-turn-helix domain-containing protein [Paenibacillus sp. 7523-1]MBM6385012.1 helix-turn-helix transcriptional regulator [Paenibacillus sp.]PAD30919.1 MarR family transcriptional regulator [Paenibacillus sp. 7523-1]
MKQYNLGIEATLEIIGGKWKALIVCLLMSGVKRTSELQRSIDGISQKVLIQQLRELERDGLVRRHVYQQMPPKVEYSLTEYGVTANKIVDVMCAWGRENIALRQQHGEEIILMENKESVLDSLPLDSIIEKKENLK